MNQRAIEILSRRIEQFKTLAASVLDTSNLRQIHRLRIAAKKLRYSIEVLGRTGYGEFEKPLLWLRALQDRLGEWHDFAALGEEIIRTASRRRFMTGNLLTCAALIDVALRLEAKRHRLEPRIVPVKIPRAIASARRQVEKSCAADRRATKPA
jgi:CHAD domain-containing protein